MLLENENIDVQEFIRTFNKKFKNFCEKAPIVMTYRTTPSSVFVSEMKTKEIKQFDFDFSVSVKQNIKIIKDWLFKNKYPRMIQIIEEEMSLTEEELEEKLNQGIMDDQILLQKKKKTYHITWVIEKVIILRDEFIIRNLQDNNLYVFKMNSMPCTLFLKKVREKLDEFQAYDLFEKKSILFKKHLSQVDENNNIIE